MTKSKSRAGYHSKPIYGGDALADLAWDQLRHRNDASACDDLLAALIKHHGQPPPDVRVTRATVWRGQGIRYWGDKNYDCCWDV